jgi:hypothetical protein
MRFVAALLATSFLACAAKPAVHDAEAFKIIHSADLAALQKSEPRLAVYDANGADFRVAHGVIPGAHMLSHFKNYDAKELPEAKDAPLVFYCANPH